MTDIYDARGRLLDEPDDLSDTTEEQDALLVTIRAYADARWDRCHDHRGPDGYRIACQAEYDRITAIIQRLVAIARADRIPEHHLKGYEA